MSSPDEIIGNIPEPTPFPVTPSPAVDEGSESAFSFPVPAPVDPYGDYAPTDRMILSKLDSLILRVNAVEQTTSATKTGVDWIGTNFASLLQTVAKIGQGGGPLAMLKLMKGGN